jgi:hypothetical protein
MISTTRSPIEMQIQAMLAPLFGEAFVEQSVLNHADNDTEMVAIARQLVSRLLGEGAAERMIKKIEQETIAHESTNESSSNRKATLK